MMKKLLTLLALLSASAAIAQGKTRPAWMQQLPTPPLSQPVSMAQMNALGIGALRPAYYLIRPTNAQMCISQAPGGLLEKPHLKLANCNPAD